MPADLDALLLLPCCASPLRGTQRRATRRLCACLCRHQSPSKNNTHIHTTTHAHALQTRSIADIARELSRLQEAAAANALRPADVSGGTFTLSNIGTIGGTYATPLVNPPEVAIAAVGRIARVPRFAAGLAGGAASAAAPGGSPHAVVPASVMCVSLGADHRVVDGATLAGFARAWRGYVENPGTLLLHLQ